MFPCVSNIAFPTLRFQHCVFNITFSTVRFPCVSAQVKAASLSERPPSESSRAVLEPSVVIAPPLRRNGGAYHYDQAPGRILKTEFTHDENAADLTSSLALRGYRTYPAYAS